MSCVIPSVSYIRVYIMFLTKVVDMELIEITTVQTLDSNRNIANKFNLDTLWRYSYLKVCMLVI